MTIHKKKLTALFSSLSLLVCTTGCFEKTPTVHESGYFQYVIRRENSFREDPNDDSAIIVGFTSEGKIQKRIDVPRELDGHPVKYIGYCEDGAFHPMNNHSVECSSILKKLYVFDNIVHIANLSGKIDIMNCCDHIISFLYCHYDKTFFYQSVYKRTTWTRTDSVAIANVVFMNNYPGEDDGGHYRLDNVEEDETIPPVPDPVKEGYQFNGWYTEKECINEWNFDTVPVIAEGEEFDLYAGWTVK